MNTVYRALAEASIRGALAAAEGVRDVEHHGLRGRAREIFASQLLLPFLYPTMGVCTGQIIDAENHQSRQTDVIIFDKRIAPPVLFQAGEGLVPCESALVAIEVKSTLTRGALATAIEWAVSCKAGQFDAALVRNYAPLPSTPCAMFAYDTDLAGTIDDEVARLREVIDERNSKAPPIHVPLSAVTIASRGHAQCIDANKRPPVWRTFPNSPDSPFEGAIRFLTWINKYSERMSSQRVTIPLGRYLNRDD